MPILVIGFSVLDLDLLYVTDVRQTSDVRQKHRLMPRLLGEGIIMHVYLLDLTT